MLISQLLSYWIFVSNINSALIYSTPLHYTLLYSISLPSSLLHSTLLDLTLLHSGPLEYTLLLFTRHSVPSFLPAHAHTAQVVFPVCTVWCILYVWRTRQGTLHKLFPSVAMHDAWCTEECPYYTTCDDITSTIHFLVPFFPLIKKRRIFKHVLTICSCWATFWPPQNKKGSLL